ncbi:MAG: T9SS type A sorting domain-containing protein, partial [Chitinophagaceae bacterium]
SRQPNNGSCTASIYNNDLKVDSILSPGNSGRKFTSTELSGSNPVTIRIKNLDDQISTDDIIVTYSVNGGTPVSALINSVSIPSSTIVGGGYIDYTFSVNANLAAVGTYSIEVTANKASDPVTINNRLVKVFKQLDNQPITLSELPWVDNFETAAVQTIMNKQLGLTGRDRYDFMNSSIYGRLRTFINTGIAYSGINAITLDASRYYSPGNTDSLIGTFNLATINAGIKNMRLDFRYKNHGQLAHPANKVWIRANDTSPWIEAYDLFANQNAIGIYKRSASIELSRLLLDNSTNFSTSFQVRWGQHGNTQAADNDGGAGYTFDDISLYEVFNDMQVLNIVSPVGYNCGLGSATPVKINIRNSNNFTVTNVPVKFKVDNGVYFPNEIISSIAANTTLEYTFTATADFSAPGVHTISAVVTYPGDSFSPNDTASVIITNQPIISSFPYLQDFESGNGFWFTLGNNNSWEYGTPISTKINTAASGTKAWKTNIAGYYNDEELSYLYSPCFNISGMTKPTLSVSLALDIEDCGTTLCDAAWVEYSTDGLSWTKLGSFGQGTNWYNKNYAGNHLWSQENYTRWHVATTALPIITNTNLLLRFVFKSDEGVVKDGIAIDDIHVYDNTKGIYTIAGTSAVVNQSSVAGTGWVDFVDPGTNKLIASINPNGQNLGSTNVQSYINTGSVRNANNYYYHDRNITIKPTNNSLNDSATVRFYFLDSESEALIQATGCTSCSKPKMAYELGVSKYSNKDDNIENGTIDDNTGNGNWIFIIPANVKKIPFDKGYYAEVKVKDFSELWLNTGGFTNSQTNSVEIGTFTVKRIPNTTDVLAEWVTKSEFNVKLFEVQVARGDEALQAGLFEKIGEVNSLGNSIIEQRYNFTDIENGKKGVRYYRLKIIYKDGTFKYSEVRSILFEVVINWLVNPNPSADIFKLTLQASNGSTINLKIFDVMGRTVRQYNLVATGFEQKVNVDLGELKFARGLYFLKVSAGDRNESFKLIKQ